MHWFWSVALWSWWLCVAWGQAAVLLGGTEFGNRMVVQFVSDGVPRYTVAPAVYVAHALVMWACVGGVAWVVHWLARKGPGTILRPISSRRTVRSWNA